MLRTSEGLRNARRVAKLTQKELADLAGLSVFAVMQLEQGTRRGSKVSWEALEAAFKSLNIGENDFMKRIRRLKDILAEFKDKGINIWDYDNPEFVLVDIYYDGDEDKVFFKCEEL